MATIRDRETSLQPIASDRMRAAVLDPITNDILQGTDAPLENTHISVADAALNPKSIHQSEADYTGRFYPDFVDPLFPVEPVAYSVLKRAFDVAFAATVLVAMSPILLLLAIGVRLSSRGPVLFKQVRVGRGGRYFHCYKFRSMCVDAESKKEELMHLNEASGPVFKIKQDPRITPYGQFLRKFSLDELPQFVNVLKGDMSIVGPRPPIISEVEMYSAHDRRRLAVLPGLTCLWQVNGRCNLSFERWVELDLLYIDTMSFWNDLKIIIKTIPAVFSGAGAH